MYLLYHEDAGYFHRCGGVLHGNHPEADFDGRAIDFNPAARNLAYMVARITPYTSALKCVIGIVFIWFISLLFLKYRREKRGLL